MLALDFSPHSCHEAGTSSSRRFVCKQTSSRIRDGCFDSVAGVQRHLDRQLAKFLRKARASLSYADFAKKVGVSYTTLHRIERGEHHITLNKLETILNRLKVKLKDVFPDEF